MKKISAALCVVLLAVACSSGGGSGTDAVGGTTTGSTAPPKRPPNIVRILTDDQDTGSMSVMKKTQALLAARGVTYTNAVVSLSLCCPSRATLLTGQYTHNHKVWDNGGKTGGYPNFTKPENSLAPWLQAAGYQTAHVGKYMNGYSKLLANQVPVGWNDWFNVIDEDRESYPYYGYTISDNGKAHTYGNEDKDYITDVFADRAVADLHSLIGSGKPFFLDYWPTAPHSGNGRVPTRHMGPVAAPKYEQANPGVQAPRSPNFLPEDADNHIPAGLKSWADTYRFVSGGRTEFPQLIDAAYRDYLNSLLSVDDSVERLVNELKSSGQLDNTLIVFMSDNGLMWGNHGMANMKWEPYEESLRVPLIITGPGFPKGVTTDRTVANIDIVPTMLEAAGVKAGRVMDGESLIPPPAPAEKDRAILIESSMFDPAQALQFAGYQVPRFKGVRTIGFQYTEWADGTFELFDLRADPAEMHNLADDPKHAGDRSKLAAALEKLNTCAGADCSVDVPGLSGG